MNDSGGSTNEEQLQTAFELLGLRLDERSDESNFYDEDFYRRTYGLRIASLYNLFMDIKESEGFMDDFGFFLTAYELGRCHAEIKNDLGEK